MKKTTYDQFAVLVPSRTFDDRVFLVAKALVIRTLKLRSNDFLTPTDWYTLREHEEPSKRIPVLIADARKLVRDAALDQAALVFATTTLAELDAIQWGDVIEDLGNALRDIYDDFLEVG